MVVRVLTDTNYFDIELKQPIEEERFLKALGDMELILLENKEGNKIIINPVNIVSLELIKTPPIQ